MLCIHLIYKKLPCRLSLSIYSNCCLLLVKSVQTIDHFRDIQIDSQTTDITHFAVVFHYDVTIKVLEPLRRTTN